MLGFFYVINNHPISSSWQDTSGKLSWYESEESAISSYFIESYHIIHTLTLDRISQVYRNRITAAAIYGLEW